MGSDLKYLTERTISIDELMDRVGYVLDEIYREDIVYIVRVDDGDGFILAPEKIANHILGLYDEEYGWPHIIQTQDIKSVNDLLPGYRRHPFIFRKGGCLAGSIGIDEYRDIIKKFNDRRV
jgi:hypothetical protein